MNYFTNQSMLQNCHLKKNFPLHLIPITGATISTFFTVFSSRAFVSENPFSPREICGKWCRKNKKIMQNPAVLESLRLFEVMWHEKPIRLYQLVTLLSGGPTWFPPLREFSIWLRTQSRGRALALFFATPSSPVFAPAQVSAGLKKSRMKPKSSCRPIAVELLPGRVYLWYSFSRDCRAETRDRRGDGTGCWQCINRGERDCENNFKFIRFFPVDPGFMARPALDVNCAENVEVARPNARLTVPKTALLGIEVALLWALGAKEILSFFIWEKKLYNNIK